MFDVTDKMTEPKLSYLGPLPKALTYEKAEKPWWSRVPWPFVVVVVLPTLVAMIYYLLIVSPRYVSEAKFVVRASEQSKTSALGAALQSVGMSTTSADAYAVHQYIDSRDGFSELRRRFDMRQILARPGSDMFSRYPRPWDGRSDESFYKGYRRFIDIGYDATTGISTLKVEAFRPRDAQALTESLLNSGEQFVNRLNARASSAGVADSRAAVERARTQLAEAQGQLTAFRNREQFIDPARSATEGSQLIGSLLTTAATLRAERAQVAAEAPNSPQLPIIDSRIAAYDRQIASERAKLAGDAGSLAPKIRVYEDLTINKEFAERELSSATEALTAAEQEARRQRLYLDRITTPSLPDSPSEPKRWIAILTVLASSLVIYGIGWFIWSGAREHRQD